MATINHEHSNALGRLPNHSHSITTGNSAGHTYITNDTNLYRVAPNQMITTTATTFPINNYPAYFSNGYPQFLPPDHVDPVLDPLSPFADARSARANLKQQLDLLLSLEDGLIGDMALRLDDAIYFLRETIENLDKILA